MAIADITTPDPKKRIWIITEGRYIDGDFQRIGSGKINGPVKEYLISDLARYLLSPEPIEVEKRLIGCEVHYQPGAAEKLRKRLRKILPRRLKNLAGDKGPQPEVILAKQTASLFEARDPDLGRHVERIREAIRPFDPVFKRLEKLNTERIEELVGICQDLGGNRSFLNIPGNPAEQILYMMDNIANPVRVVLERAYMAEGLFELKGFDFTGYDGSNTHRLLKFFHEGSARACVLDEDKSPSWVDDVKLVQYMQLFEQSIRNNAKLRDSLGRCISGQARPMKLLFNSQLEIDYSRANLPRIYKEVIDAHNMGDSEKAALASHLNNLQIGVAFNYVPRARSGEENLYTDISVMQDVRALEPIKEELPQLYSEMAKRAAASEGGRFYLLDAIRGIQK